MRDLGAVGPSLSPGSAAQHGGGGGGGGGGGAVGAAPSQALLRAWVEYCFDEECPANGVLTGPAAATAAEAARRERLEAAVGRVAAEAVQHTMSVVADGLIDQFFEETVRERVMEEEWKARQSVVLSKGAVSAVAAAAAAATAATNGGSPGRRGVDAAGAAGANGSPAEAQRVERPDEWANVMVSRGLKWVQSWTRQDPYYDMDDVGSVRERKSSINGIADLCDQLIEDDGVYGDDDDGTDDTMLSLPSPPRRGITGSTASTTSTSSPGGTAAARPGSAAATAGAYGARVASGGANDR
ncbi:unnamed protein product, partial [Phaeothamnion confervicola]